MVFMVAGILFVILCGFDLAYTVIILTPSEPELEGHSVKFNQTGALIPVVSCLIKLINCNNGEKYKTFKY